MLVVALLRERVLRAEVGAMQAYGPQPSWVLCNVLLMQERLRAPYKVKLAGSTGLWRGAGSTNVSFAGVMKQNRNATKGRGS